ncbi:MAG: peptidylprolyl isomerase [Bacteroidales bacterium]|nr:peptidylprolyl isomerase [Candidatus Cacconaster merdequi]
MNKRIFAFTVGLVCFAAVASAQVYENGIIDKSVAIIGNDVIMLSQLESEAQTMSARGISVDKTARCEILEGLLTAKLFLVQARLDSIPVQEANVEATLEDRLNETITYLGGEEKVEEYFKKPIYKLRQEWKEQLSEQSLIQDMQGKVAKEIPSLTPRDIEKYCKETPEEDLPVVSTKYRIRQIGVYPDKKAAELAVKEKLISLRERVLKGEKFSTLARLYSEDPGSMSKGGELGMASRNIFWPAFSDAAMSLKPGQVSQVIETPDGYHIIQLIERKGDMFNARHILIKPHYTTKDRENAFRKLDSIRTQIVADSISFFNAAFRYSEDTHTAASGGLLCDPYTGSSYFEKDQLKPSDYAMLKNMEEGDISEPFESLDNEGRNGNTIYKIICLDKIIPSHTANYKEDFSVLCDEVNKINAEKAIDEFIAKKQKTTYIVIDPMFRGCAFKRDGWIKE